jgi:hypothetical protein
MSTRHILLFIAALQSLICMEALAQAPQQAAGSDADELAKALSNPVAALISVPFQYNYDQTFGQDGYRHNLNLQPVVPISISERWNLISRTILPITYQNDVIPGTDQAGIGDITQSFFFSPKEPTQGGLIWGVGPALLLPTGTDDLGADTWGMGPTLVVLKQDGPWTYGALANHIVDVGGGHDRVDISNTFLQPFVSRGLGGGVTVTANLESTYDWKHSQWTVPTNLMMTKVTRLGGQMISVGGGVRVYAESPAGGPDWGVRFVVTLLYPR